MRLPIIKYGDPILRAQGKHIEKVDERIRALASDMLETMHAANASASRHSSGRGAATDRARRFAG